MTRYTPEQIEIGARTALEHARKQMGIADLTPREWGVIKHVEIPAFTAGVATLPDHTAELLEALEAAAKQFSFYADQHMAKVPSDTAKAETNAKMALRMEKAIRNAKTQTKGGATG